MHIFFFILFHHFYFNLHLTHSFSPSPNPLQFLSFIFLNVFLSFPYHSKSLPVIILFLKSLFFTHIHQFSFFLSMPSWCVHTFSIILSLFISIKLSFCLSIILSSFIFPPSSLIKIWDEKSLPCFNLHPGRNEDALQVMYVMYLVKDCLTIIFICRKLAQCDWVRQLLL